MQYFKSIQTNPVQKFASVLGAVTGTFTEHISGDERSIRCFITGFYFIFFPDFFENV